MTSFKTRKRSTRYRGSKTHGGGSMKKRRGAGHRGGRGRAGSGKRGDAKKPSLWKDAPEKGFSSQEKESNAINIGQVNSMADRLVREGKALEQAGSIVINLTELGYDKLLGSGKVTKKLKIGVALASPKAVEKATAAGGSVDSSVSDKAAVLAERQSRKGQGKKDKKKTEESQESEEE